MAYTSITGNQQTVQRLRGLAKSSRVAHAYIFAGPEGVGKKMAALEFARALLCEKAGQEACEKCATCGRTSRGTHAELKIIQKAKDKKEILIAQVRETIRELSFAGQGRRIILVDEAERMNEEAMNAFLKTLEEAPRDTILILITSSSSSLLPTIRSRCHTILFFPLSEKEILSLVDLPEEEAKYVVALAEGSAARALELARDPEDWREECKEVLEKIGSGDLNSLVEGLTKIRDLKKARSRARRILRMTALSLRDKLRTRGDDDVDDIADQITLLLDHERMIDMNVNVALAVENALLRIEWPVNST